MKRLAETNMVQTVGYGEDEYCASARARIRAACDAPDADIHFFSGGTQANTTVIAAVLRPWQGVLSAASGHINCHEAGAIEATGHKVIALPTDDGKITAQPGRRTMSTGTGTDASSELHRPARHGLHLPPHRGRHALYQGGADGDLRRLPALRAAAVHRRRAPGLRPDGRRDGRDAAGRSRTCATCSTSAAPRSARCSARPW